MNFFSTNNILKAVLLAVLLTLTTGSALMAQGWEIYFGGIEQDLNYDDYGQSIIPLADKGSILVGASESFGDDNDLDIYVVRMDVDGTEVWSKTYDEGWQEYGYAIKETSNGTFIISGFIRNNTGSFPDAYFLEIDADGNLLWSNQFGFDGFDVVYDVVEAHDGGFVFAGQIENVMTDDADFLILKTDAAGNAEWVQILGGTGEDIARAIIKTDTGYAAVGHDKDATTNDEDILLVTLDIAGNIVWQESYDFSDTDFAYDLLETSDAHFVIGGSQNNSSESSQATLLKVDKTDGSIAWLRTFGGELNDEVFGLVEADDQSIVAVGVTEIDAIDIDFLLTKYSADGTQQWFREIGREGHTDWAGDVHQASNGGYVLVGYNSLDPLFAFHDVTVILTDEEGLIYTNHIQGKVYFDENSNCAEEDEIGLNEWLIIAESEENTFYGSTDENGAYSILLDTGSYDIRILQKNSYWESCVAVYNDVQLNTFYDTTSLDFPMHASIDCPLLNVDVSATSAQSCTNINYTVHFCNDGTVEALLPYVQVVLDEDLDFNSATIALTSVTGDTLVFDLEDLGVGECGEFIINVASDCNSIPLSSYSVTAHIFPDDICTPVSSDWDMSDIKVSGTCEEEEITFRILNDSDNDMEAPLEFIVFEDLIIQMAQPFDLGGGEDTLVKLPVTGATYRLIAEQAAGHPGNSYPTVAVEGCTDINSTDPSVGIVTVFQEDENNAFLAVDVQEVGNTEELRGYPKGYPSSTSDSILLTSNTDIEYHLQFQNTTTSTVNRLVIRDTLPEEMLDLSTFSAGASSHSFRTEVYNGGIVKFTFENMNLPSMDDDAANSEGFVRFKISQKTDLPAGSIIRNRAELYMGYEAPRQTNEVIYHIGGDEYQDFATINLITNTIETFVPNIKVSAFPNPFVEGLTIEIEGENYKELQVKLYDEGGRLVMQKGFSGNQVHLGRGNLPSGILFFSIEAEGKAVTTGKVMVK